MKKALIIDDIEANKQIITKCLHEEGYEVAAEGNGMQATKLIMNGIYNIIVLDMKLPSINVKQLLNWMKLNCINIPVIVASTYGTVNNRIECNDNRIECNDNRIECNDNRIVGYIEKPFSTDRFRKFIIEIEKKLENKDTKIPVADDYIEMR